MSSYLLRLGFVLVCCLGFVAQAAAPSEFDRMLSLADDARTADPEKFRQLLVRLDRMSEEASVHQKMHLQVLHAYRMTMNGELSSAVDSLESLLEHPDTDVVIRFRAGSFLANTYALTRDFTRGLLVLEKTLALEDEIESQEVKSQGYLSATVLYNQVGQFGLGRYYAEKVIASNPKGRLRCFSENLRLEALQGDGMAPDDGVYFAAVDRCNAIQEPIGTNLVRSYLAKKWHSQGRTEQALDLLERHLPEVLATQYKHLIGEFHALIAEYRLSTNDHAAATRHANAALAQSGGFLHTLPLVSAYKTLYAVAESRGDIEAALNAHIRYSEADKAHLNESKARELAYQLVRHETLQKTQQIEMLNQQKQLLELQQQVADKSAQNSQLMLALLVGLLASIGYWAFKTKRLQVRLRRMAEIDMLTGVCNRHRFTEKAEKALAQCARSREEAALVMFDLDHFKLINDRFGHAVGDWALKQAAAACTPLCRPVDCFGRLGGEEFGVLMAGCDLPTAERLADECRRALAAIDGSGAWHDLTLTASFGVTTSRVSGYDLARMLSHADKALYRAKRGGRNRVCAYKREISLHPTLVGGVQPGEAADATGAAEGGNVRSAALS